MNFYSDQIYILGINQFTLEPPVTACPDPRPSCPSWHHQCEWSRTTLSTYLCRVKRPFQPHQIEHNSVKDTREKVKKPCNIDLKVSMKILLHSPLLSFHLIKLKLFPQNEAYYMPSKRKKRRQEKWKKREGEKTKSKSLSVHAWT